MTETNLQVQDILIPLRLKRYIAPLAAMLCAYGCLCLFALSKTTRSTLSSTTSSWIMVFSIALFIPALVCIFYRRRACLILSESGLRWRTWGDWRRTSWDGVIDYYDYLPIAGEREHDMMTIETEAGKITLNRRWRESSIVRQIVQERARQTENAEWGIQGQRASGEDSRVFSYRQDQFRIMILGILFLLPYTGVGWHWLMTSSKAGSRWIPGHLWESLGAVALDALSWLVLAYAVTGPLLLCIARVPELVYIRRHRAERITTYRSGITFSDGRRTISAAWDEITGYFLEPSALSRSPLMRVTNLIWLPQKRWHWIFVVETTQGAFEFSPLIDSSPQLGHIIRERAMPLQKRDPAPR